MKTTNLIFSIIEDIRQESGIRGQRLYIDIILFIASLAAGFGSAFYMIAFMRFFVGNIVLIITPFFSFFILVGRRITRESRLTSIDRYIQNYLIRNSIRLKHQELILLYKVMQKNRKDSGLGSFCGPLIEVELQFCLYKSRAEQRQSILSGLTINEVKSPNELISNREFSSSLMDLDLRQVSINKADNSPPEPMRWPKSQMRRAQTNFSTNKNMLAPTADYSILNNASSNTNRIIPMQRPKSKTMLRKKEGDSSINEFSGGLSHSNISKIDEFEQEQAYEQQHNITFSRRTEREFHK